MKHSDIGILLPFKRKGKFPTEENAILTIDAGLVRLMFDCNVNADDSALENVGRCFGLVLH